MQLYTCENGSTKNGLLTLVKDISVQAQQNIQLDWIFLSPDNPTLVFFFFCGNFVRGPVLNFKLQLQFKPDHFASCIENGPAGFLSLVICSGKICIKKRSNKISFFHMQILYVMKEMFLLRRPNKPVPTLQVFPFYFAY